MYPSYSPRRVTVDAETGRPRLAEHLVLVQSPHHSAASAASPRQPLFSSLYGTMSVSPIPLRRAKSSDSTHSGSHASRVCDRLLVDGALQAILTGLTIAVVFCPVMIGFTSMIFSHHEFAPALPVLTKLVFMSSVAHQTVITLLSPLPFAIGQTQDAGLVFLSTMATSIMLELGPSVPLHERVATVVVHLSLCTALTGLGLIALGKLRLASLVQYLPAPVIGGYLAYIGFFMVKGGLTLMTGVPLTTLTSWMDLVDARALALVAPGVACGLLLFAITSRYQHFAVFPSCLVVMPAVFFLVMVSTGSSINQARMFGYLSDETPAITLSQVYSIFEWHHIHWHVMFPSQLPTLVSMFVVIAFASSLDIASITMGTASSSDQQTSHRDDEETPLSEATIRPTVSKKPRGTMDFDQQLQTVGASNLLSGLVGGYTGSYIFSQTLFSFRFHPASAEDVYPSISRLIGLSVIICELALVATPFSLSTIVPKFVFGAVMIFIGVDLMRTWLLGVYHQLLRVEYLTVVATFIAVNALGVQLGLVLGVALATLSFLVEYSRAQGVRIVHKTSNAVRNAEQHELLHAQTRRDHDSGARRGVNSARPEDHAGAGNNEQAIVTVELQGHIFFGSATRIQRYVKRAVFVARDANGDTHSMRRGTVTPTSNRIRPRQHVSRGSSLPVLTPLTWTPESDRTNAPPRMAMLWNLEGEPCLDKHRVRTRFVVFDFAQVSGLDATAARTCFLTLKMLLHQHGIRMVFCGMRENVRFLLRTNDVIPELQQSSGGASHVYVTSDVDLALDWCEQELIAAAAASMALPLTHLKKETTQEFTVQQIFLAYLPVEMRHQPHIPKLVGFLAPLFRIQHWQQDDIIFAVEDPSDAWYVLLCGQVTLHTATRRCQQMPRSAGGGGGAVITEDDRQLVGRIRAGCIFGDLDFMLAQTRSIEAVCTAPHVVTAVITRQRSETLRETRPEAMSVLQEVVLRATFMTLADKLHSIVV